MSTDAISRGLVHAPIGIGRIGLADFVTVTGPAIATGLHLSVDMLADDRDCTCTIDGIMATVAVVQRLTTTMAAGVRR